MTENDEITEHEAYQSIMAYRKDQEKRIQGLENRIEQLTQHFEKQVPEKPREEIAGTCWNCGHTLTTTEAQKSACPYCEELGNFVRPRDL
jgi:uncharacterized CHY-type Zn-finger protein